MKTEKEQNVEIKLKIHLKSYPITGLAWPLEFHDVEAPTSSRQSGHEGGKIVSSTHRPPLLPRR